MAIQPKRRTIRELEIPIFCADLTPDVNNLNYTVATMVSRDFIAPAKLLAYNLHSTIAAP